MISFLIWLPMNWTNTIYRMIRPCAWDFVFFEFLFFLIFFWMILLFCSILLFPSLSSRHRLILHQLRDKKYPNLFSFSVGEEKNSRRTIICFKSQLMEETNTYVYWKKMFFLLSNHWIIEHLQQTMNRIQSKHLHEWM